MGEPDPRIRRVERSDLGSVVELVHELADYEREAESCTLVESQLEAALFGEAPSLFGHVAVVDHEVVGCSLWFRNFSTWHGVHGIYLEDLIVRSAHRGKGLGRALLVELARECTRRGYARLEWSVLDWNEPAIAFYRSIGAASLDEWSIFRLTDAALARLGEG
ncbi:MAG TPA: GNAT family N-acetyltransferase [Acidimicrobiales bacterium]|jgi:GNAT superfamily N-acetyltransferase|nr:GNAT family N-acetyltransferase [Acidimicrobiales bacterium]